VEQGEVIYDPLGLIRQAKIPTNVNYLSLENDLNLTRIIERVSRLKKIKIKNY
jgi:hypothetical protein